MAGLCAKCGAALSSDMPFCAMCGASVAAAAPAAAAGAPGFTPVSLPVQPLQPPAAFAPAVAPVPLKSGSSAVKIILIVVAIFVAFGIIGVGIFGFTVWRISRAFHVNRSNGEVTLHTSGGTISANSSTTLTASDLGTDIYPGAQSTTGGMRMDLPDGLMVSGVFLTSDSKDAVVSFYKNKFGADASVFDTGEGAVLTANKGPRESIVLTVTAKEGEHDGKTKISIVHTKNNKSS